MLINDTTKNGLRLLLGYRFPAWKATNVDGRAGLGSLASTKLRQTCVKSPRDFDWLVECEVLMSPREIRSDRTIIVRVRLSRG